LRTRPRQRLQRRRRLERAIAQHSGRSMGSFTTQLSALNYQHSHAALAQRNRKRKADDAATNDDDIPLFHFCIVEE
jgi:hypothetical protein